LSVFCCFRLATKDGGTFVDVEIFA
jgi:hypothetical protein